MWGFEFHLCCYVNFRGKESEQAFNFWSSPPRHPWKSELNAVITWVAGICLLESSPILPKECIGKKLKRGARTGTRTQTVQCEMWVSQSLGQISAQALSFDFSQFINHMQKKNMHFLKCEMCVTLSKSYICLKTWTRLFLDPDHQFLHLFDRKWRYSLTVCGSLFLGDSGNWLLEGILTMLKSQIPLEWEPFNPPPFFFWCVVFLKKKRSVQLHAGHLKRICSASLITSIYYEDFTHSAKLHCYKIH